jgi:hypothetical protein
MASSRYRISGIAGTEKKIGRGMWGRGMASELQSNSLAQNSLANSRSRRWGIAVGGADALVIAAASTVR